MATKKKSSKKAKAGQKAAAKKPAAKKVAGKTGAKKAAPKKAAPKKAAAKKATPKQAAAKKATPKKAAPKQAAPKQAPKTAEVSEATEATEAAPIADAPAWASAFPPVLQSLVDWVNGGRLSGVDFEMYQGFNEQYKPSDWTRNPATDAELFTFGMDGTGGQVAIWRNDAAAEFDALPIVFLGSEGEVHPLATSLPQFLHELAHGLGPLELTSGGEVNANDEMLAWVKVTYPQADLGDPLEIFNAAKQALAGFEQHLSTQTQT